MCSSVAGRALAIVIDGEEMFLDCKPFELALTNRIEHPDVRVETDGATILDTIDAKLTLDAAIRVGRVFARGKTEDLVACHGALLFFVRGAVRSPSFPGLLEEFRWFVGQGREPGAGNRSAQ
jgi:hypothetical protein